MRGTVGLDPAAYQAPDLVHGPRGMLVAPGIQVAKHHADPEEEAQLLEAQVGASQRLLAGPAVGGHDELFQHVESRRLDTVAEQEALAARELVERGD
jgi:hypothetical protein